MTSLWRHLWSTYRRYRVFLLSGCAKLMVWRVLKIWRWSVCNFGRYRKKTRGGGAKNSPPDPLNPRPCQSRVKRVMSASVLLALLGKRQSQGQNRAGPRQIRGRTDILFEAGHWARAFVAEPGCLQGRLRTSPEGQKGQGRLVHGMTRCEHCWARQIGSISTKEVW